MSHVVGGSEDGGEKDGQESTRRKEGQCISLQIV